MTDREILQRAQQLLPRMAAVRRDLHAHPELGWMEVRSSALLAEALRSMGLEVLTGKEVCLDSARMGMPSEEQRKEHFEKIKTDLEGLPEEFLQELRNGFTGIIGILRCGEGPTVAIRCDMDALPIYEEKGPFHMPNMAGFASTSEGVMHACGHDGHMAMGIGTAKLLTEMKQELHGTVKLIFQPAEEGVRGAKAIVEKGHLDDVDFLLGAHMSGNDSVEEPYIAVNHNHTLSTTKLDVVIHGLAAHAGVRPDAGKNALLAACAAVQNLQAIPRKEKAVTRVNVGKLEAGTGRNVIPDRAFFEMEVRGDSDEANSYMYESALRIIDGACRMQDCTWESEIVGETGSCLNSDPLMEKLLLVCERAGIKAERLPDGPAGASEDFAEMAKKVTEQGGQVCYFRNMSLLTAPIHNGRFDFQEQALVNGAAAFAALTAELLKAPQ